MTKFKKVLFGFFGAYLFTAIVLAHAQNAPEPDASFQKEHSGKHIQEIYKQLNLTDDQKQQLDTIKQQHRARMVSSRQELKADKETLQQELMKPQLDMSKINAIHNQIKSLQSQMEDDRLSSILAVRSILTPEQFLEFNNLMHKHKPDHE